MGRTDRSGHDLAVRDPGRVVARSLDQSGDAAGPAPIDDALADPTLIEWMLDRTPEQRLEALQGFVDSLWELRGGRQA